ncbi:hypothetical protein IMY05_C2365000400 [Salix suchowensis]|nr:hypothetical protein IMY05_C2365000400 [Salix suchowensis]
MGAEGGSSSFPGLSDEQWAKLRVILGEPKEMVDKMTDHSSSELLPHIAPSPSPPPEEEEVNLLGRGHRQRYPSI